MDLSGREQSTLKEKMEIVGYRVSAVMIVAFKELLNRAEYMASACVA
jgi:hypothetical protein